MDITYKNIVRIETKKIDAELAKSIQDITTDICKKLEKKEIDVIDKEQLIEEIKNKNEFIQKMFEGDFAETQKILSDKMKVITSKPKNEVDFLSSRILNKEIDNMLENVLKNGNTPLEISTILDRKLFLNRLLGLNQFPKEKGEREM